MDFVSDFALLFDESEYEDVSDDEYEHGMDISDSEEENDVPGADDIDPSTVYKSGLRRLVGRWRNPKLMEEFLRTQTVTRYPNDGRRYRRADTNILSMKCDKLLSCRYTYSAKAVYCKSCYAILSHISLVQNKIWTCEFCGTENQVRLENEELPRYAYDDLSFLLEPAVSDTVSIETDDTLVIFCIDISGSMCVTTPVAGKFRLRGVDRPSSIDLADQYLPGEDKDITYVSRLQAAQAAIDQQLEDMSRKHPNRRVALVTFNSQVQVIGDGTIESITVSGDALLDKDELNYIGSTIKLPKPISNTREILGDKVFELEEGTVTALGPALTVAVSIASQRPRSKVIICTDGRANSGLGKLDELNTDEDEENARKFYKDVGTHALKKGVAVSVIGIKGTDCKMVHLGKLADITGGQVNMVDPQTLPKEFSNILAEPVIATNVTVTLVLPNKLYCYDSSGAVSNRRVKTVGNVTSSTEITFQYNVKSNKKRNQQNQQEQQQSQQEQQQCQQEQQEQQQCQQEQQEQQQCQQEQQQCQQEQQEQQQCQQEQQEQQQCQQEQQQQQEGRGSSDTSSEQLPFQLQVHYKALNGAKILRVFTEKRPVTRDRKLAERRINLDILGKHTANVTAQLAMDGKYTRCRSIALMNQRLASRYTKASEEGKCQRNKYKRIFKKIKSMENEINTLQKKERLKLGHTYSDDEDEVGVLQSLLPDTKIKITTKINKRTSECNDETATLIYQCKSCKFN